jgi:hypothetical protein
VARALAPSWEPRDLVYPGESDLPHISVAAVDVHAAVDAGPSLLQPTAAARTLTQRATLGMPH